MVRTRPIVIVAGPTAVGKSALAIQLAETFNGEVINLDSVQIYKGFVIGAAQPSDDEKRKVPHHLFGTQDPKEKMSVGRYLKLHRPVLEQVRSRGNLPIFCGGTSLYVNGVIYGLSDLPEDAVVRDEIALLTTEHIAAALQREDAGAAAVIHAHDRLRLSRALEVKRLGSSILEAHEIHKRTEPLSAIIIMPMLPRDKLYSRIDERSKDMIRRGLLEETKGLLEAYGAGAAALGSIGYSQAVEYLLTNRYSDQEQLTTAISQATRRFAKRQMTWARNEPQKKQWTSRPLDTDEGLMLTSELSLKKKQGESFRVWDCNFEQLCRSLSDHLVNEDAPPIQIWFVPAERML